MPVAGRCETHHLWFMPLCLLMIGTSGYRFKIRDLFMSGAWVVALSTATFYIVPIPYVKVIIGGRHVNMRMNINMIQVCRPSPVGHWFNFS